MSQQSIQSSRVRIVITGGIGSGKSTVVDWLSELGVDVIAADEIGHEVLRPGGGAFRSVAARWPEVVRNGRIDRGALARIVFSDESELRQLESLTHPAIAAEIRRRVAASTHRVVAVELPIGIDLVGPGWVQVVVTAPDDERIRRAVARGLDEEDVRRRMAVQPDPEEWRSGADYVIVNDGSIADLRESVDELWEELTSAVDAREESRIQSPESRPDGPSPG